MVSLQYKGRIYKSKLSLRNLRYILTDQAARAMPALQRRWLFPTECRPVASAAASDFAIPSAAIEAEIPEIFVKLGVELSQPLKVTQHYYELHDTLVTGWAGAMMKDGLLLAISSEPHWTALLRPRKHMLRTLPSVRPYYNLMAAMPVRGHVFHWLFDAIIPLITFLESGGRDAGIGLIVNAEPSGFQQVTINYLRAEYGIEAIEPVGAGEAVRVPILRATVTEPANRRGLQNAAGLAGLDRLGEFVAGDLARGSGGPARIYISRNDAKLRRVRNEERILAILRERGFESVTLGGMPIAQQVQHFRQAEAVVAPHGAGLAHTAWCRRGTKIVEFFPGFGGPRGKPKNATGNMWLIAVQRGLDYWSYLAGPPETREDLFTIPEELLLRALDTASIR